MISFSNVLSTAIRFFFLLTPFFVLSMFLALSGDFSRRDRRILAHKVAFSAWFICVVLLFFGRWIFAVFGITINAFRIGGGALLFLSAVKLVNGAAGEAAKVPASSRTDIAVVPLAIPVIVGPATTGALLIIGAEAAMFAEILTTMIGMTLAFLVVWGVLCGANFLERILKQNGIVILSKLTGLILAAMASEMMFTGIRAFFR